MYDQRQHLDTAVDTMIEAANGWRYDGATLRHPTSLVGLSDRAVAVQGLLDELDDDLGLRLPAWEQARLRDAPLLNPDGLTDAVLAAEGLAPDLVPSVRDQVRNRVADWLLRMEPIHR
jgi:hypothetical protein